MYESDSQKVISDLLRTFPPRNPVGIPWQLLVIRKFSESDNAAGHAAIEVAHR